MNNQLNVVLEEPLWKQDIPSVEDVAQKVFEQVLSFMQKRGDIEFLTTAEIEVNLSLSNDDCVHKLNREFRGLDRPTNVLSFANIDSDDFAISPDGSLELGDIIIALETMQREASEQNISLHDHFCHLLTHGLFHLLGFDHQTESEAATMEALETEVLEQLNIANPYKEL